MKTLLAAVLLLGPALAAAQVDTQPPPTPAPQYLPPGASQNLAPPPPQEAAPAPVYPEAPQTYSYSEPAPTPEAPPPTVAAPPAAGQWVYTTQYGWVWMPYGTAYTYLPAGGAYPDMYVYWPAYGWRWVIAPWVWGVGPRPYFGVYGWARFGWYGRGYGHWYGYRPGLPAWAHRGYGWGHPVAPGHIVGPRPGGYVHPVHPGGYVAPVRPGGYVVPVRPGGYVAPVRPGGFARSAPSIARPAPVGRSNGGFGGGHPAGLGRR